LILCEFLKTGEELNDKHCKENEGQRAKNKMTVTF